jgi:hypothetical protein
MVAAAALLVAEQKSSGLAPTSSPLRRPQADPFHCLGGGGGGTVSAGNGGGLPGAVDQTISRFPRRQLRRRAQVRPLHALPLHRQPPGPRRQRQFSFGGADGIDPGSARGGDESRLRQELWFPLESLGLGDAFTKVWWPFRRRCLPAPTRRRPTKVKPVGVPDATQGLSVPDELTSSRPSPSAATRHRRGGRIFRATPAFQPHVICMLCVAVTRGSIGYSPLRLSASSAHPRAVAGARTAQAGGGGRRRSGFAKLPNVQPRGRTVTDHDRFGRVDVKS